MPHRGTLIVRKSHVAWTGALKCALAILFMLLPAFARDNGQWEKVDPVISGWIRGLMQPDNPRISCCGQADAYWADGVEIKDGQVIAIVTDTRPDIPLGRPHIPVGTRIIVPAHKLKWDRGNPTGHTIIFLSYPARDVLCYVTGTHSAANCDVHFAPKIGQSPPTSRIPTSVRVLLRKATCLPAGRFVFLGVQVGWRNSPPNYWLFLGVMTTKSMPLPKASHGDVRDAAKYRWAASKGTTEASPVILSPAYLVGPAALPQSL